MRTINIKNIGFYLLIFVAIVGCDDDFVNTKPLNEVPEEEVWADAGLAEAFVIDIYNGFGQGGFDEQMQASLTDEALFTHPDRGINTITESRSNPANQGWINYNYNWGDMYSRIRATNIALTSLEEPMFDDQQTADRLAGEAHFLRAFYYHQLVRYYGGVPLVDKVYELGADDFEVERNTFAENIEFIVADLDNAITLLDGKPSDQGRATVEAALALKARILTYAASDLHDMPTATSNSAVIAGFSNPEYLGYTDGDQSERWRRAQEAAKAVVDLGRGYNLDYTEPVSPEEGEANYMAIAMGGGSALTDAAANIELLLGRYFVNEKSENGGRVGLYNGPNGYHNWAGNSPTQNLVDDYEMIDGTAFNWNNPDHKAEPYNNRDPRFYASILYDGADWKPRTADVADSDPYNQIQTGDYEIISSGEKVMYNGIDTRDGAIENWNGSYTGYYMRKFVDPDPAIVDQNTYQEIPFPMLRYTEAVLNYVEASIELGQEDIAREWLSKIRFRAGMPAVTVSGDDLMERYRNERRVELAYEEHRFHDTRRWMIAPQTLGQQVITMNVTGTLKPGASVTQYHYDPESYNYEYTTRELDPGIENRAWDDKMYYISIHRDEINRNDNLVQNPGY